MTGNHLRCGVYLPPFGPFGDPHRLVDLAVRAEAAGWDGVFLWDHLLGETMPIVDPWTTLGAIAQVTNRIRLGTTVTPLARRRPWVVARHAATLSNLSNGRFILGTGLGSDESGDFSRFGEPDDLRTRSAMFDEGLDIVRAMWSGETYRHTGPHYEVRLEATTPEPHHIPIWVANSTNNPKVIRRAARHDGIFPHPERHTLTPDELVGIVAAVDSAGRSTERRFDVVVAGNASPAWNEPTNVDLAGLTQAGMTWWMESLIHYDPLELSLEIVDAGPPQTHAGPATSY
ncbi:LLM class flavin-dependent oxidoreductase [Nocardia sp. XZ_19_369]|uniref:LLM class flavin-dependent oxidoreductase n=1 Tax=Nocardia sp. XZ_19_369 TaxID=2769487 RepID=UPI001E59C4D7|nr:LLM class flavin-dependent oxidoreductase [Nocardia sp. XZ_19_369]